MGAGALRINPLYLGESILFMTVVHERNVYSNKHTSYISYTQVFVCTDDFGRIVLHFGEVLSVLCRIAWMPDTQENQYADCWL